MADPTVDKQLLEMLTGIRERLAALESGLRELRQTLRELKRDLAEMDARQRTLNGRQQAAAVLDEEIREFMVDMARFREEIREWKGGMDKRVGLVALVAGAIPPSVAILFLVLRGAL